MVTSRLTRKQAIKLKKGAKLRCEKRLSSEELEVGEICEFVCRIVEFDLIKVRLKSGKTIGLYPHRFSVFKEKLRGYGKWIKEIEEKNNITPKEEAFCE